MPTHYFKSKYSLNHRMCMVMTQIEKSQINIKRSEHRIARLREQLERLLQEEKESKAMSASA